MPRVIRKEFLRTLNEAFANSGVVVTPARGPPLYDDFRGYYEAKTGRPTGTAGLNIPQKADHARQI